MRNIRSSDSTKMDASTELDGVFVEAVMAARAPAHHTTSASAACLRLCPAAPLRARNALRACDERTAALCALQPRQQATEGRGMWAINQPSSGVR